MAINYASKYSEQVQERFRLASITANAVNSSVDFVGVNAVNIYSIPTVGMNDYTLTGSARYGVASELQNTVQTLTMAKDRSFTFTIDKRNNTDTQMAMDSGAALKRQIEEVIVPEIDTYRLSKIVAGAGTTATAAAITAINAYGSFLKGVTTLLENKVPLTNAVAYISANFYTQIRLDPSFIKASDMAQDMLVKGQVGMVEGIPLIYAPGVYLPAKTEFVITNAMAVPAAQKLEEYKIHDNPPGINGWLVEGRVYYDAWVLDNYKKAIYVHPTV